MNSKGRNLRVSGPTLGHKAVNISYCLSSTTSPIVQAGTNRLLVLVAEMKQAGVFSKVTPLGLGPPNSTERNLLTMIAPVFLESGVGVLCILLRTETSPSGPREEDKFLSLQP